jgi:hypothetical protein
MNKNIFIALFIALTSIYVSASGGNLGIGAVIGEPTGLSFKLKMGQKRAIDGALAVGFFRSGRWIENDEKVAMYARASHLWLFPDALPVTSGSLPVYLGAGARLTAIREFNLGVRGSAGIAYIPAKAPIDIFFEIGLVVDFIGSIGSHIDAGMGLRYFF